MLQKKHFSCDLLDSDIIIKKSVLTWIKICAELDIHLINRYRPLWPLNVTELVFTFHFIQLGIHYSKEGGVGYYTVETACWHYKTLALSHFLHDIADFLKVSLYIQFCIAKCRSMKQSMFAFALFRQ